MLAMLPIARFGNSPFGGGKVDDTWWTLPSVGPRVILRVAFRCHSRESENPSPARYPSLVLDSRMRGSDEPLGPCRIGSSTAYSLAARCISF